MIKEKIKQFFQKQDEGGKKSIENIVFLVLILIVTVFIIDNIWKDGKSRSNKDQNTGSGGKVLADLIEENKDGGNNTDDNLENKLGRILSTIKGVGKVNVFINYSQSSSSVPIYDETTTTSSTSETDSSGGVRNVTETQTQKDVIFKESGSDKVVAVEKIIMPKIEGAIITAEGADDVLVKTNIISAVEAVTGLTIDKVQVFEMN